MKLSTRLLIKVSDAARSQVGASTRLPIVPDALIKPEFAEPVKPGDKLELRRPDGSVAYVILQALRRPVSENAGLFIELGPSVTIDDFRSALKFGRSVACQFDCRLSPLR